MIRWWYDSLLCVVAIARYCHLCSKTDRTHRCTGLFFIHFYINFLEFKNVKLCHFCNFIYGHVAVRRHNAVYFAVVLFSVWLQGPSWMLAYLVFSGFVLTRWICRFWVFVIYVTSEFKFKMEFVGAKWSSWPSSTVSKHWRQLNVDVLVR